MFVGDLSAGARTLLDARALVILTVALHLAVGAYLLAGELERRSHARCLESHPLTSCHPHPLLGVLGLVYFLASLFLAGFYGTQRLWFLRARRGEHMDRSVVWRISWAYFGRFFTLGLISSVFFAPAVVATIIWYSHHHGGHLPWTYSILAYVAVFFIDVFATFVVPALTFSTRRVWVAIPAGIRMLARTWPQSAWYAIAPPITVLVIGADFIRRSAGIASAAVVTVIVGPIVGLLAKSATALYYVRLVPDVGPTARRSLRYGAVATDTPWRSERSSARCAAST